MHEHASIHTSLKGDVEGRAFPHLCAPFPDRVQCAPRHLAPTDSVTDPRVLCKLLAPQEGMVRSRKVHGTRCAVRLYCSSS